MFTSYLFKKAIITSFGLLTPFTFGAVGSHFLFNNIEEIKKLEEDKEEQEKIFKKLQEDIESITKNGGQAVEKMKTKIEKANKIKAIYEKRKECLNKEILDSWGYDYLSYKTKTFHSKKCETQHPFEEGISD